jgi:D-alanyl-D-alanine carboxypeptidase (penicillin-binding protein 5/6)
VKTSLKLNKHIQAPIKKGDEIGKIVLIKNGKVLSENSAIAAENVKPASWWTLYKRSFSMFTKLQ